MAPKRRSKPAEVAEDQETIERRMESTRVALRERQLREEAHARVNAPAVAAHWRQQLRQMKLTELRTAADVLRRGHHHQMECQAAIIKALQVDVGEEERQHEQAAGAHLAALDSLLSMHQQRLAAVDEQFEVQLTALLAQYELEGSEMQVEQQERVASLEEGLAHIVAVAKEATSNAASAYGAAVASQQDHDSEEHSMLQISMGSQLAELEQSFESAHQDHLSATSEVATAVKALSATDAGATHSIEDRMQKLAALQASLSNLRSQAATSARDWAANNGALASEKDALIKEHVSLKAGLSAFRATQALRLKQLSVISASAAAQMCTKAATADHILKLHALCGKMQSPEELALAWEAPAKQPSGSEAAPNSHIAVNAAIAGFLQRHSKVVLDKAELDEEAFGLEQQNAALRGALQACLEGSIVSDAVLSKPDNSLLIVNERLQRMLHLPAARGPPPVCQLLRNRP